MTRRERLIRQMIATAGLTCTGITLRGSGHYQAAVLRPDGERKSFIFSNTPSDHRGDLNKRAMVKRWAKATA